MCTKCPRCNSSPDCIIEFLHSCIFTFLPPTRTSAFLHFHCFHSCFLPLLHFCIHEGIFFLSQPNLAVDGLEIKISDSKSSVESRRKIRHKQIPNPISSLLQFIVVEFSPAISLYLLLLFFLIHQTYSYFLDRKLIIYMKGGIY